MMMGLAACGASALPVAAQALPHDFLTAPLPAGKLLDLAPELGATPAQRFTLTEAPPPPAFRAVLPGARGLTDPVRQADVTQPPAPMPPSAPTRAPAPLPPSAPVVLQNPKPIVAANEAPDIAVARPDPLSEREIVERANAYFTNLGTLVASFTQVGGDGRRLGGSLYLQRPGKLRFEYDKPATLEVVADGSSVAVRDRKLATQDLYSISQTPLKFLLRERVNLGKDIRITHIAQDGDSVRLSLEDRSTLGGTSQIVLYFDPQVENMTQWRITDPQGFQTVVMLDKVDRTKRLDQSLFAINYDRVINTDNLSR
jgi:outer membrane lipoprotein-sorting protein